METGRFLIQACRYFCGYYESDCYENGITTENRLIVQFLLRYYNVHVHR